MPMTISIDQGRATLKRLVAAIARSPIVVARGPKPRLPAGFDEVDIAILEWIAAEGRAAGHRFARM
jgi:hypothetical protein